jgi:hypothetical protein
MTAADTSADPTWGPLAETDEQSRAAQVEARYSEIAALPEEERRRRLRAMMEAEYALSDQSLRTMTMARLRAFLSMDEAAVQAIVGSLDTVMKQMSGQAAMRRVALVQTLAQEFTPEEQHHLRTAMPGVFGDRPTAMGGAAGAASAPAPAPGATRAARPWWAFWRKG